MKIKFSLITILIVMSFVAQAQLKLGLPNGVADASAILDLSNRGATVFKGFLPPQLALVSTNQQTPISTTPALGLLVYNTATTGIVPYNVTPGYYYWSGVLWVKFSTSNTQLGDNSIYATNGTLAANRTVTMAGNQLNFIGGNVDIGATTAIPSAILSLTSTTQGLLIPQVTSIQKLAIVAPANGLMVYDTDLSLIFWYNGSNSSWMALRGGTLINADTTFLHNQLIANTSNITANTANIALTKLNSDSTNASSGYTTLYRFNSSNNTAALKKNNSDSVVISGYTTNYQNSLKKNLSDTLIGSGFTTRYTNGFNKLNSDSTNLISGYTTLYQFNNGGSSKKNNNDSVNFSGYTSRYQGNKTRDSLQVNIDTNSVHIGLRKLSTDSIGASGYTTRYANSLNKLASDSTNIVSGYTTLYQFYSLNSNTGSKKNTVDSTNAVSGYTTLYQNSLKKNIGDSVAISGFTTRYTNGLNKLSSDSTNIISGYTTLYEHNYIRDSLGAILLSGKLKNDSVAISGYTTRYQLYKSRDSLDVLKKSNADSINIIKGYTSLYQHGKVRDSLGLLISLGKLNSDSTNILSGYTSIYRHGKLRDSLSVIIGLAKLNTDSINISGYASRYQLYKSRDSLNNIKKSISDSNNINSNQGYTTFYQNNLKEPAVTAPNSTKQYWNGYKSFVALNSDSILQGSINKFSPWTTVSPTIINYTNNVGIGTTAPASKLHVASAISSGIPLGGLGGATATDGSLVLYNATNTNTVTINSGATSSSYNLTLPISQATAVNQTLLNNGSGILSWGLPTSGWSLLGNAATVSGTNFIGTTDNIAFNLRVNNIIAGRIDAPSNSTNGTYYGYNAGKYLTSTGINNTAIGNASLQSISSGSNNTAVGFGSLSNNSSGNNTAIGSSAGATLTTGTGNSIIGASTTGIATGNNNTIIGAGITSLDPNLSNNIILSDGAGNQRININNLGSVGIGNMAPNIAAMLDITSTSTGLLIPRMTTTQKNSIATTTAANGLMVYDSTLNQLSAFNGSSWSPIGASVFTVVAASPQDSYYNLTGNIGIGVNAPVAGYKLQVNGAVTCTSISVSSDSTLKKNIVVLEPVLNKLLKLGSYTYNWKDSTKGKTLQYGVLAQEVEKVFPAMVEESTGHKTVNYTELIPVLLQAIKEQQSNINMQQVQIDYMMTEIKKLSAKETKK